MNIIPPGCSAKRRLPNSLTKPFEIGTCKLFMKLQGKFGFSSSGDFVWIIVLFVARFALVVIGSGSFLSAGTDYLIPSIEALTTIACTTVMA